MGVLVACKNEEDPIKNEGARVVTTLFIDFSDPQGQLTPKLVMESSRNSNSFKLLWMVLLPARMKKIHPKMKALQGSQHFSHYKSMKIFPDAQGQLTHKSLVRSCQISNPLEILWLFAFPTRIKNNQSKLKELEWSQDFPHYNPMEAICLVRRVAFIYIHTFQSNEFALNWLNFYLKSVKFLFLFSIYSDFCQVNLNVHMVRYG